MGGTEGVLIIDGVIIDNNPHPKYHVLAIDDDGNIKTFVGKTGDEILSEGYKNATTAFAPVIVDGVKLGEGYIDITGGAKTPAKRQILAINAEGDYEIYSFKSSITFEKSRDLLFDRGISFAYQLDGGGSTSLYVQDQEIYDVESRPIIDVIVFEII